MAPKGEPFSIFQPTGYNASTCGYCGPPGRRSASKSSRSYGLWAHQVTPSIYKLLIDRGWRRSGCYLYKPDLSPGRSCCPSHTIRCDVNAFKSSKSQRQTVNRFVRFVKEGDPREAEPGAGFGCPPASEEPRASASASGGSGGPTSMELEFPMPRTGQPSIDAVTAGPEASGSRTCAPPTSRGKKPKPPADRTFDLVAAFSRAETFEDGDRHRFEIVYEDASLTDEKFELYKKYQLRVHNDPPDKVTPTSFDRFLCTNPFPPSSAPFEEGEPLPDGAVHALYRLDGVLIAFAVLDVLPDCISSVYFVWDPDYAGLGLGKLGALREIAMAKELDLKFYYMGFYIHSCVKMRYKGEYSSSFLLNPRGDEWHPLEECRALLDRDPQTAFEHFGLSTSDPSATASKPASSIDTPATDDTSSEVDEEDEEGDMPTDPPPSGVLDPRTLPLHLIASALVLNPRRHGIERLVTSKAWQDPLSANSAREALATLGYDIGPQVLLYLP